MSRSFGVRSLTITSPIRISPSLISSSPASIRRAVVLPQPEGPTSTISSPSWISRSRSCTSCVPAGKTFATESYAISAMPVLVSHDQGGVGRQPFAVVGREHGLAGGRLAGLAGRVDRDHVAAALVGHHAGLGLQQAEAVAEAPP